MAKQTQKKATRAQAAKKATARKQAAKEAAQASQERVEDEVSTSSDEASDHDEPTGSFALGTKVTAPWTNGKHYPGVIYVQGQGGHTYIIQFDDGDMGLVNGADLKRIGSLPRSEPSTTPCFQRGILNSLIDCHKTDDVGF